MERLKNILEATAKKIKTSALEATVIPVKGDETGLMVSYKINDKFNRAELTGVAKGMDNKVALSEIEGILKKFDGTVDKLKADLEHVGLPF